MVAAPAASATPPGSGWAGPVGRPPWQCSCVARRDARPELSSGRRRLPERGSVRAWLALRHVLPAVAASGAVRRRTGIDRTRPPGGIAVPRPGDVDLDLFAELPRATGAPRRHARRAQASARCSFRPATTASASTSCGRRMLGGIVEAMHAKHIAVVAWYLPALTNPAVDLRRALAAARFVSAHGERSTRSRSTSRPVSCGAAERTRRLLALSARMRAAVGPLLSARSDHPLAGRNEEAPRLLAGIPVRGLARQVRRVRADGVLQLPRPQRRRGRAGTHRGASRSSARRAAGRECRSTSSAAWRARPAQARRRRSSERSSRAASPASASTTTPGRTRRCGACSRARDARALPVRPASRCASASSSPRSSARCAGRSSARSRGRPRRSGSTRSGSATTCSTEATAGRSAGRGTCGRLLAALAAATERVRLGPLVASPASTRLGWWRAWRRRSTRSRGAASRSGSARAGTRPSSARSGSRSTTASRASRRRSRSSARLVAGERVTLRRAATTRSRTPSCCRRPARPVPLMVGSTAPRHARRRAAARRRVEHLVLAVRQHAVGLRRARARGSTATSSAARACLSRSTAAGASGCTIRKRAPVESPPCRATCATLEEAGADEAILVLDPITEAVGRRGRERALVALSTLGMDPDRFSGHSPARAASGTSTAIDWQPRVIGAGRGPASRGATCSPRRRRQQVLCRPDASRGCWNSTSEAHAYKSGGARTAARLARRARRSHRATSGSRRRRPRARRWLHLRRAPQPDLDDRRPNAALRLAGEGTRSPSVPGSASPAIRACSSSPSRSSAGNGLTAAGTATRRQPAAARRSTSRCRRCGGCRVLSSQPARAAQDSARAHGGALLEPGSSARSGPGSRSIPSWLAPALPALLALRGAAGAADPLAHGLPGDERARDAVDVLVERRRPEGTWRPGPPWWGKPGRAGSNVKAVDWGRRAPDRDAQALRILGSD